ncbi:MAG TPA: hypothetical protein DCP28_09710, partial [Cytophagales bacterium]|nr:hypothetical protein [Cytophagales bacterium]
MSSFTAFGQIAENEGGGNGTTTAGGVITVTTQNTITGSVQFNAGDVNDYWWVDDGVSGTIIFTWSDDVRVFLRQYGNAGRTGAFESNTQVSSGASTTLLASKFYAFFVQDNPAAQGFTSYSIAITGTALPAGGDSDPPNYTAGPATSSTTAQGFDVSATIDETGDIFYVVVPDGSTAPTVDNVIAGESNGGGTPSASGSALAGTSLSATVTGLNSATTYDVYFAAQDDETPT